MISEQLITLYGFTPSAKNPRLKGQGNHLIDSDCYLRIHEQCYLVWDESIRYFSIVYRYKAPKGRPGGGVEEFNGVVLPQAVYNIDQAAVLLSFFGIKIR